MRLTLINSVPGNAFPLPIRIFEVIAKGTVYGLKMRANLMSLWTTAIKLSSSHREVRSSQAGQGNDRMLALRAEAWLSWWKSVDHWSISLIRTDLGSIACLIHHVGEWGFLHYVTKKRRFCHTTFYLSYFYQCLSEIQLLFPCLLKQHIENTN